MPDWVNKGTVGDLSPLAEDSMWPTSQAAGNMSSSNAAAMTAPGSMPVDPLPDRMHQSDPQVTPSGPEIEPGTSGKPQARTDSNPPPRPEWVMTRTAWPVSPEPRPDPLAEVDREPDEPHPGTTIPFSHGAPRSTAGPAGVTAAGK
jgi:hypothetical protein